MMTSGSGSSGRLGDYTLSSRSGMAVRVQSALLELFDGMVLTACLCVGKLLPVSWVNVVFAERRNYESKVLICR